MNLHDFYKKYESNLSKSAEFESIWGLKEKFKITQHHISPYYGQDRTLIYEKLTSLFSFEAADDCIHKRMLSFYFDGMQKLFLSQSDYKKLEHLDFSSDKLKLNRNQSITLLKDNPDNNDFMKVNERVIWQKGLMVDEDATYYNYTIIGIHGFVGRDTEHMKFSYYVKNDVFYFVEPKTSAEKSKILSFPLKDFEQYTSVLFDSICHKIFIMFYKNRCNDLFGKQVIFSNLKPVHLQIANLIRPKHRLGFNQFMSEQMKTNSLDVFLFNDDELINIYKDYFTTFEMTQI